jgi:hypothetical protein
MHLLHVNPRWFEDYWYSDPPLRRRRSLSGSLGRLALCILVVVGGAAVLIEQSSVHGGSARPEPARVRFM